ncbi:uncharacterized protein LOC133328317, partial [Musca vetustissima]|uniref:uncharacterized protein LOC133328317 n=1 Tax=Musca vetustissima TaxID=27455 RepID=UPI002AB69CBC
MLEKSNKISVMKKLIGLGETEVKQSNGYIVPQNSTNNFYEKAGLIETKPKENTTLNQLQKPPANQCPHCENMAKNFLYLESLIRTNAVTHNGKSKCSVCHSSLCYLEYVNKSILEVFGDFDSIAKAAKAFGNDPSKAMKKMKRTGDGEKKFPNKKPLMMDNVGDTAKCLTKPILAKKQMKRIITPSKPKSNVENLENSQIVSSMSGH